MANPPPPYDNITGISRAVMKDNAQETLANYDGNARPGELVVNLVVDPPALYIGNNLGQLTAISSGGNITSAYGQFWSNATQTVALPNTEYRFTFNNSDLTSNVVLGTGASNSRIIINQTGIYNIEFSAQIDKAPVGSSTSSAYVWFKKNGTAVPDSAGFSTLDNAMQDVLGWNILANVANVGDYYEIAYAATHTYVSFPTIAGNVTVGYPASPSIIVTITPVDVNN
jgi:hypothetical protein